MELISNVDLAIPEKLRGNPEYRRHFFRGSTSDSIALQIRELRKRRGDISQAILAERSGMKQSSVSRIEQSEYSAWSLKTLWRVAEALDSRVVVTFQPIEEAIGSIELAERSSQRADVLAKNYFSGPVVQSSYTTASQTDRASGATPTLVETGETSG